jgi:hypothetical protein
MFRLASNDLLGGALFSIPNFDGAAVASAGIVTLLVIIFMKRFQTSKLRISEAD